MATANRDYLKTELQTYERHKDELLHEHGEGKFALIQDNNVDSVWDTYEDALRAGYQRFGLKPFLVKQLQSIERVQFIS